LNLTLLDTKIPSTAVIIMDNTGKGPQYSLGAGCNPNIGKAFARSLEEAWSIYYHVRSRCVGKYDELPKSYEPFVTPVNIQKRLSIWGNSKMKDSLDFFIGKSIKSLHEIKLNYPKKFANKKEELAYAVKTLSSIGNGYKVYAHLSENKILKKTGFCSARVIVPKLIPMYYSEQNAPIESERIKNKSEINTLLHLFP